MAHLLLKLRAITLCLCLHAATNLSSSQVHSSQHQLMSPQQAGPLKSQVDHAPLSHTHCQYIYLGLHHAVIRGIQESGKRCTSLPFTTLTPITQV